MMFGAAIFWSQDTAIAVLWPKNALAGSNSMSVNNRGKKILLVDDDQGLRTVLAEQLDLYDGFTTIQVGTAAEGMEKAKLAHYDAILLDIGLPDMDGRELCKLMR